MADQRENGIRYLAPATTLNVFTDLDRLFEQVLRQDDACMPTAAAELLARIATEDREIKDGPEDAA